MPGGRDWGHGLCYICILIVKDQGTHTTVIEHFVSLNMAILQK